VSVRKNSVFRQEFLSYLNKRVARAHSKNAGLAEQRDVRSQSHRYIGLCALYAFYFAVFKTTTEKKLFRLIWDLYKQYPLIHLHGDFVWVSTDFLSKKVPLVQTLPKQDVSAFRREYLRTYAAQFPLTVRNLFMEASVWMVRIESNLANRADIATVIETRIKLLTEGVRLANKLSELYRIYVNLHLKLRKAIPSPHVPLLMKCVELLKAIQSTFHRRSGIIGETLPFMVLQVGNYLQNQILPIKARLQADKKFSVSKLDSLAALTLALSVLNCCGVPHRHAVLELCMHLITPIAHWKEMQQEEINFQIDRLSIITHLRALVQQATDCSFLFWNQSMLPVYFRSIRQNPKKAYRLPYIFAAFRDITPYFAGAVHESSEQFERLYKQDVLGMFDEEIVHPLQTAIENDLRFHIHCHLKVQQRDPFRKGIIDYRPFLELPPIRFFERNLYIKQEVSHYLDETFYNLNTVQLSDWKTYGEMRNLAKEKYALELTDVHLPGQTLEQGLDVLEIMRAIHVFVAKYSYNLNNQIFIERSSDSKFLNTINIQHIANSIRTHGTGIMNTAVNFTYQFLRRKFSIFSQFLFDDYIKSHLFRDARAFRENRKQFNNQYPYEQAERFNKEIKKLGINNKGQSYMDQFRGLVTEIGNAMGYIRMIRSAGMLYTGNAIKFVPDLRSIPDFQQMVEQAGLSQQTVRAAENLDSELTTLAKNFAEGTDYFKMLVAVFMRQFRDPKNLHLKNFYTIVPPLMINFIDHSIQMKEKLAKKKQFSGGLKQGSNFTDDGFAIGVAYILKLLEQNEQFNSLHWFDSIQTRFEQEQQKIQEQTLRKQAKTKTKKGRKSKSHSFEVSQSLALTAKKLQRYNMEFQLLKYSFDGARVFFKSDETPPPQPTKTQDDDTTTAAASSDQPTNTQTENY